MFCYLNDKSDTKPKICSPGKFTELVNDRRTAVLIDAYRSGQNPGAKSMLPAFLFQGYDPKCLEQGFGSRKKAALLPTGLFMMDFDHIGENPHAVHDRFLRILPELGLTLDDIALSHVTPSGKGLREVIRSREGTTVAEDQKWIADALGMECDEHVKDLSRISFVPKKEDILYLNGKLLFAEISGQAKAEATDRKPAADTKAGGGRQTERKTAKTTDTAGSFPQTYHGVPYSAIVGKWIELKGGRPEPGDRHATLVELAMDLRKICDNDKEWIASVIPDFDKGEEEKLNAVQWAVEQKPSRVGGTLKDALRALGIGEGNAAPHEDGSSGLPPGMPENLPSLVRLLTSKVLPHQRPAVSAMVFPALAVHVNNCLFKLRDNTDVELSLMCCLLAQQSVGKGCVKPVLKRIMADIKAQDRINRERERQWQEQQKNRKANEKGQSKPDDLVIRYLSSDTTPAAFLGRLFAAEHGDGQTQNLCTYSQVDEIEDLYRFCQSGGKNMVQQMIKRTWDRDDIGAERFTAQAANIATVLRWNWAASSTVEGGRRFFRNCLTDGTASRVDFCTIIEPDEEIDFRYGDYDAEFERKLRPYIERLSTFRCRQTAEGEIIPAMFPEVREFEDRMKKHIDEKAKTMPDNTWRNYAWRSMVMAVKKLIVLHIANGCRWEEEFGDFAMWSFEYSMWCKLNLFYDDASSQFADERLRGMRGNRSPLKLMPRQFSLTEFAAVMQREGYKQEPAIILSKYKHRGLVIQCGGKWEMTAEFAEKYGIK